MLRYIMEDCPLDEKLGIADFFVVVYLDDHFSDLD